jgi:hypothetical protein
MIEHWIYWVSICRVVETCQCHHTICGTVESLIIQSAAVVALHIKLLVPVINTLL